MTEPPTPSIALTTRRINSNMLNVTPNNVANSVTMPMAIAITAITLANMPRLVANNLRSVTPQAAACYAICIQLLITQPQPNICQQRQHAAL